MPRLDLLRPSGTLSTLPSVTGNGLSLPCITLSEFLPLAKCLAILLRLARGRGRQEALGVMSLGQVAGATTAHLGTQAALRQGRPKPPQTRHFTPDTSLGLRPGLDSIGTLTCHERCGRPLPRAARQAPYRLDKTMNRARARVADASVRIPAGHPAAAGVRLPARSPPRRHRIGWPWRSSLGTVLAAVRRRCLNAGASLPSERGEQRCVL